MYNIYLLNDNTYRVPIIGTHNNGTTVLIEHNYFVINEQSCFFYKT